MPYKCPLPSPQHIVQTMSRLSPEDQQRIREALAKLAAAKSDRVETKKIPELGLASQNPAI